MFVHQLSLKSSDQNPKKSCTNIDLVYHHFIQTVTQIKNLTKIEVIDNAYLNSIEVDSLLSMQSKESRKGPMKASIHVHPGSLNVYLFVHKK